MAVRRDIPRALDRSQRRGLTQETNRILRSLRTQQRAVLEAFLTSPPNSRSALAALDRALARDPAVRRAFARLWLEGGLKAVNIVDGALGLPVDPPAEVAVRRNLQRGALRRVRMVNTATRRQLRKSIVQGFDAGLSQEQIARGTGRAARALRETGWKPLRDLEGFSQYRADTIARTERALVYARTSIDRYEMYDVDRAVALDGAECGLRKHGVLPYANGRRFSLATAKRWPIAHPRCVRGWAPDV